MNVTQIWTTGGTFQLDPRVCRVPNCDYGPEPGRVEAHKECGLCAVHCAENGEHGHSFSRRSWTYKTNDEGERVRQFHHGQPVSLRIQPWALKHLKDEAARRDCPLSDLLYDLLDRGWKQIPGPLGYAFPEPVIMNATTAMTGLAS